MIYLACPYSHEDHEVMIKRFKAACFVAGNLMRQNTSVYSPISHSHSICDFGGIGYKDPVWYGYDLWYVDRCEDMMVVDIDGWKESKGVALEIAHYNNRGHNLANRIQYASDFIHILQCERQVIGDPKLFWDLFK